METMFIVGLTLIALVIVVGSIRVGRKPEPPKSVGSRRPHGTGAPPKTPKT